MSVCGDSVGESSRSKVLDALKTRYSCLYEPLPAARPDNRRYLTSLRVYVNREGEEPQSPLPASFSKLMIDQSIIDPQIIKEKVTSALACLSFREPRVLVQFWSPVAVRNRCLLTTLDQPFGLGVVDEGLYLYRLESEQRIFVVDGEHREELGPPGRVYHQKLPEWSLDIRSLSSRQCVKDWAACYNIHGYINLPVFEPRSGCCVGVLEVITSSNYIDYAFEIQEVSRALKEENLKSPNVFEDHSHNVGDDRRQHELDDIFYALKTVCDIQKLPLAMTWALSGYSSIVANSENLERSCSSFNRSCIGKVCMSTAGLPFYVRDLSMWGFQEACSQRHLDKSQGVVGKSLLTRGLCFCGDVTKLSIDEYPLAPFACVHGITSCLTVYLKSLQEDDEYVVEFFLPKDCENEADLRSLVKTVKQQIKNTSRVQLGVMLSPQVIGGVPFNWDLESPPLTEEVKLLPELENQQPLVENEQNNADVTVWKNHNEAAYVEHHMEEDKLENEPELENQQPLVENEQNNADVTVWKNHNEAAYVEHHMEEDKLENEPSNSAAAGTSHSVVPYLEVGLEDFDINSGKKRRKYDKTSEPTRKRKRIDRPLRLEEIRKHYGKTMEEAADSLRVSRSTLKRICRSFGIPRWPYSRTPNESDSLLKSGQTDVIHASEDALEPVFGPSDESLGTTNITSDSASLTKHGKHSSTLVLHRQEQTNLPDGCAEPKTAITEKGTRNIETNTLENLTIKATYRENTIKFPFSLSDGLVKLEELVATRFQLSLGSFSLKYEDEDHDMILIACHDDLMGSLAAFRQPVIRLLVSPVVHQNPNGIET